ncbi:uncharacterized protein LOC117489243 isoform X1 [Trematomus bernacchii]|uniref:uncharacterized protein LOC117489243 isoform X1 n=1 Tax=Trematomus bernacchii TaxID=40690 RepID=UPI00146A4982|nr:uncharacterized protein LOC117489243 isoform X1 [Trematomus bernacchii]
MSEFRRIIMSSFLMLLLHFTAADGKRYSCIVRAGDEVTLPFDNVIDDQDKCESTTWLFSDSRGSAAVTLFEDGQIQNDSKAKSDRLRITEKCSLVIKKVTEEDVGSYTCRQFNNSGQQQGPASVFYLSVVTMTEHQDNDEVMLDCSVKRYGRCDHSVKWLLQGQDVDKDHREKKTSQSLCSASVTFLTSLFSYTSGSELFTCEVTDTFTGEEHLFLFSPQSSGEDKKPASTKTTSTTTAKNNLNSGEDAGKGTAVSTTWTTVRMRAAGETTNTASENNHTEQEDNNKGRWWWIIVVIVGVAALTIITVAVIRRKRTQGNETQTDDNVADPEDGVSYASISYTRKSSRKARAHLHDDDEDDAVTYSTVGAPSSSSAASADPSLLYATVNKPRKKPM